MCVQLQNEMTHATKLWKQNTERRKSAIVDSASESFTTMSLYKSIYLLTYLLTYLLSTQHRITLNTPNADPLWRTYRYPPQPLAGS